MALRELFGPGFLDWATTIHNEVDFGINDRQLWFLWRLRERTEAELEEALENAGELFRRLRFEMEEHGVNTYPAGPWHAGLEPFPAGLAADALAASSRLRRAAEAHGSAEAPAHVAPAGSPSGSSKPPISLCGTSASRSPVADQVAADLEVLLPAEVGSVGVGGQAGASRRRAAGRRDRSRSSTVRESRRS